MENRQEKPLKSVMFFSMDYGRLGRIAIALPENNGGDEQFEDDFAATLDFVKGVMSRRKSAAELPTLPKDTPNAE